MCEGPNGTVYGTKCVDKRVQAGKNGAADRRGQRYKTVPKMVRDVQLSI